MANLDLRNPNWSFLNRDSTVLAIGLLNLKIGTIRSLWQYGLLSFQTGGTKLEKNLPKNQHTQRKLLNFDNWVNGEVSKIGHHFSK